MQIIIDYDHPPGSDVEGRHYVETAPGGQPQVSHPALGTQPVDVIHWINAIHTGLIPIAGTGWEVLTKHPLYPGQSRLDAFVGEILRLNDVGARTVLGV